MMILGFFPLLFPFCSLKMLVLRIVLCSNMTRDVYISV